MKENVDLISAINDLKREWKLKLDNINWVEQIKEEAEWEIDIAFQIKENAETIKEL